MEGKAAVLHLLEEHEALRVVLDQLERALAPLSLTELAQDLTVLGDLMNRHRRKEEEVFFPALVRALATERGPTGAAAHEHGVEEAYLEEAKAFLRVAEEDEHHAAPLVEACRSLLLFLRDHLWKEENFVFPCADRVLSEDDQRDLARRMSAMEVSV